MTEYNKPAGYVDQAASTTPAMQAVDGTPRKPRTEPEPSSEIMGALKLLSTNLFDLTNTVKSEARKNDNDRSLTNAAIQVLQAEVAQIKAGAPRLPTLPPPPAVRVPPRDELTSTGQHAIVVASAALQAAESAHAAAAASVDYSREQERAKAEIYGHLRDIVASGAKSMKLYLAIGGILFTTASAVGGYFTVREANKDVAKDTAAEVKKEIKP